MRTSVEPVVFAESLQHTGDQCLLIRLTCVLCACVLALLAHEYSCQSYLGINFAEACVDIKSWNLFLTPSFIPFDREEKNKSETSQGKTSGLINNFLKGVFQFKYFTSAAMSVGAFYFILHALLSNRLIEKN